MSKTVCLDERTAALVGRIVKETKQGFSEWVRAAILAWDEDQITEEEVDRFSLVLAELPTARLAAIVLGRLGHGKGTPDEGADADLHAALLKWMVASRDD